MESNIVSTPANTMGAGDPALPSETSTGNIGATVKNKCEKSKRKKKMKPLKDFIEKSNITEAVFNIKSDKGIAGMLAYAHNHPPQAIVVEYTKLRWAKINEHSNGVLKLTSTGEEFDRWNKKFLISGTNRNLKDLECIVHIGKDKDYYLMIDIIGGRPKDKYESQMYVEFDNYYYEE